MYSSGKKRTAGVITSTNKRQKISEARIIEREEAIESDDNVSMELDQDDIEEQTYKKNKKSRVKERVITRKIEEEDENKEENELDDIDSCNLPCRDSELQEIEKFIVKGLYAKGAYTSLYISGMPGTGKTASVNATISKLKEQSKKNKIPPFDKYYINAMKMTKNNNFYKVLHDFIFSNEPGKTKNFQRCCTILDNFFKNRSNYDFDSTLNNLYNHHIILVIDEIDCLIDKKQNILYNIFNWTTYIESKLIVISISNTLDLPERLMPKIVSRIGNERLSFKPYNRDDLITILQTKLRDINIYSNEALKYCCMKVASISGDLRRILQICKRAEEIYYGEKNRPLKIMIAHVNQACNDLFDSKVMYVFKHLKIYEKIVLISIMTELKKKESTKVSVNDIYQSQLNCNKIISKAPLNFEELRFVIYNLVKLKLLQLAEMNNENFISNSVVTKFYPEEFTDTIKNDPDELVKKLYENTLSSSD